MQKVRTILRSSWFWLAVWLVVMGAMFYAMGTAP